MAVSELNVRIAVMYKDFDKSMRQVEGSLMRTSRKFDDVGNRMTVAITAPLLAFGAKAIQAAGNAEALEKAMVATMANAGYSTEQARAELEALRKVALAPGIDLEQAVQGSVRLQSVEMSASAARETLKQLANAIASTGGAAPQLDSVTKQFSQMLAKGRILQEDLGIIQENMPAISAAMEKAFGTRSATQLQNMGVSAEAFIKGVTAQLAELPRVEGGIKNSMSNASSAVTQFFASVGTEINKTLELGSKTDSLAQTLGTAAQVFSNLDSETKKTIITYGLYALAAGPALKVTSALFSAGGLLIGQFRNLGATLISAATSVSSFAGWFGKLNMAMKASVIGAAIVAATALYGVYDRVSTTVARAAEAQTLFSEAQKEITKETAKAVVEIDKEIAVLRSDTAAREEKIQAFNRLKASYPELLAQYDSEKISLAQLTALQKNLTDAVVRRVAEQRRATMVDEQATKVVEAKMKLADIEARGAKAIMSEGAADRREFWGLAAGDVADEVKRLNAEIAQAERTTGQLNTQFERAFGTNAPDPSKTAANLYAIRDAEVDIEALNQKIAANWKSHNVETAKAKKQVSEVKDEFEKYLEAQEKARAAQEKGQKVRESMGISPLEKLPTAQLEGTQVKPMSSDMGSVSLDQIAVWEFAASLDQTRTESIDPYTAAIAALNSEGWSLTEVLGELAPQIAENGSLIEQTMFAAGSAMAAAAAQGETSFAALAGAAMDAAADIIRAEIMKAVAAHVAKTITFAPPFVGLALGAAAGAAAGALFNGLLNKIRAPKLAKGGLAFGETLATVGDNPRASVDPEVIAPLSKLRQYMGGENSQPVTVVGRISGKDIMLSSERGGNDRKRYRGQ